MEIFVVHEENNKKVLTKLVKHKLDEILDTNKRKPIIDYKYEILDIGIGPEMGEKYKKKYKINETRVI